MFVYCFDSQKVSMSRNFQFDGTSYKFPVHLCNTCFQKLQTYKEFVRLPIAQKLPLNKEINNEVIHFSYFLCLFLVGAQMIFKKKESSKSWCSL